MSYWVAKDFMLCTDFYDEESEKQRLMEESWDLIDDKRDEIADKEWYWKNKHLSKCEYLHGDWDTFLPKEFVRVPAPIEKQPYRKYINCAEFVMKRFGGYENHDYYLEGINNASKLKDPRTHGFLAQLNIPSGHYDSIYEDADVTECRAEVILDHRLYKPTLMSWLNVTKTDIEFYEYFKSGMKGAEPKYWSDEYHGYDNYCPFEPGEYLSDGVYASDSWSDNTHYLYKISEPDKIYDPETREEIDGW